MRGLAGAGVVCCHVGIGGTGAARAVRTASANAFAVGYRSAGFFAIPRATTASSAGGNPGRSRDGIGGGAFRCAPICAAAPSPRNGRRPVTHSKNTHASA